MNKIETDHLLKILDSWAKAYLAPSATMAIKQAIETIESLVQEINMLETLVDEQRAKIEELSKPVTPKFPVQSKKVKKADV